MFTAFRRDCRRFARLPAVGAIASVKHWQSKVRRGGGQLGSGALLALLPVFATRLAVMCRTVTPMPLAARSGVLLAVRPALGVHTYHPPGCGAWVDVPGCS